MDDMNNSIQSHSIKFRKNVKEISGDSIKLHFDDSTSHINKIDNYISNKKSNLMKKINDKICFKDHINNLNSYRIDSDYQGNRLAKINSRVQKFVYN